MLGVHHVPAASPVERAVVAALMSEPEAPVSDAPLAAPRAADLLQPPVATIPRPRPTECLPTTP